MNGKRRKITVRLTNDEYDELLFMMKEYYATPDGNVSDFVRKKILKAGIPINIDKDIRDVKYQINKVGVNVNQIAKKINSGFIFSSDVDYVVDEIKIIEQQFTQLVNIVKEKTNGNH